MSPRSIGTREMIFEAHSAVVRSNGQLGRVSDSILRSNHEPIQFVSFAPKPHILIAISLCYSKAQLSIHLVVHALFRSNQSSISHFRLNAALGNFVL